MFVLVVLVQACMHACMYVWKPPHTGTCEITYSTWISPNAGIRRHLAERAHVTDHLKHLGRGARFRRLHAPTIIVRVWMSRLSQCLLLRNVNWMQNYAFIYCDSVISETELVHRLLTQVIYINWQQKPTPRSAVACTKNTNKTDFHFRIPACTWTFHSRLFHIIPWEWSTTVCIIPNFFLKHPLVSAFNFVTVYPLHKFNSRLNVSRPVLCQQ